MGWIITWGREKRRFTSVPASGLAFLYGVGELLHLWIERAQLGLVQRDESVKGLGIDTRATAVRR